MIFNSLCSPDWPWMSWSFCLSLETSGFIGGQSHAWPFYKFNKATSLLRVSHCHMLGKSFKSKRTTCEPRTVACTLAATVDGLQLGGEPLLLPKVPSPGHRTHLPSTKHSLLWLSREEGQGPLLTQGPGKESGMWVEYCGTAWQQHLNNHSRKWNKCQFCWYSIAGAKALTYTRPETNQVWMGKALRSFTQAASATQLSLIPFSPHPFPFPFLSPPLLLPSLLKLNISLYFLKKLS